MNKLETLIELNNLEKNRNRFDDKLKHQEYYGNIEELFDPLTKTLNLQTDKLDEQSTLMIEGMYIHQKQTLHALEGFEIPLASTVPDRQRRSYPDYKHMSFRVDNQMNRNLVETAKQTNKQL